LSPPPSHSFLIPYDYYYLYSQVLHPPEDLIEADEVWDFDSLLREVTQELHSISKTVVNATVSTPASESGGGPGKKGKKGGKKK
jgi:hypothetical protein